MEGRSCRAFFSLLSGYKMWVCLKLLNGINKSIFTLNYWKVVLLGDYFLTMFRIHCWYQSQHFLYPSKVVCWVIYSLVIILPYEPLSDITLLFSAENWCKKMFLLNDTNPTKMFLGNFFIVLIKVCFSPVIYSYEMHKSIMKNNPLSPTLPSMYSSHALFPISAVSWFPAPQKLQFQLLVCLFFDANGFKAALQVTHMGGVTLMGLRGTKKGE